MALNFERSDEQEKLKEEVARVGQAYHYLVASCDREHIAPHDLHRELGKRNLILPFVPTEYGGMGKGAMEFSIITEELSRAGFLGPNPLAQTAKTLLVAGREDQKRKYLPQLCSGEIYSAVAISEKDAGTSWARMTTKAVKQGNRYILDGQKSHINYAMDASVLMVYAKTETGISVFLVDPATPGISFKKTNPIGLRLEPIADAYFTRCEIPEENLLGKEGHALEIFIPAFNLSRVGNASRLIGISRGAIDAALPYARERKVGENTVTDFQGIRWMVADFFSKLEMIILMRDKAAWKIDQGLDPSYEVAIAKVSAALLAEEVTSKVFSLTGAWGLFYEQPFEKFWRDAMVGKVGGGSVEMLKNFIARRVLGKSKSTKGAF